MSRGDKSTRKFSRQLNKLVTVKLTAGVELPALSPFDLRVLRYIHELPQEKFHFSAPYAKGLLGNETGWSLTGVRQTLATFCDYGILESARDDRFFYRRLLKSQEREIIDRQTALEPEQAIESS